MYIVLLLFFYPQSLLFKDIHPRSELWFFIESENGMVAWRVYSPKVSWLELPLASHQLNSLILERKLFTSFPVSWATLFQTISMPILSWGTFCSDVREARWWYPHHDISSSGKYSAFTECERNKKFALLLEEFAPAEFWRGKNLWLSLRSWYLHGLYSLRFSTARRDSQRCIRICAPLPVHRYGSPRGSYSVMSTACAAINLLTGSKSAYCTWDICWKDFASQHRLRV